MWKGQWFRGDQKLMEKKADHLEVMHFWKAKWEEKGMDKIAAGMKEPAVAWSAQSVFTNIQREEYYEKQGKSALQELSTAWKEIDKDERAKIEEEFKAQKEKYNKKLDILRKAMSGSQVARTPDADEEEDKSVNKV